MTATHCWVAAYRSRVPEGIALPYLEIVEEALCFGWIDSTNKKLPDGRLAQRISPRRKRSHWTELNKQRCADLQRRGLMTDAGRAALPAEIETKRLRFRLWRESDTESLFKYVSDPDVGPRAFMEFGDAAGSSVNFTPYAASKNGTTIDDNLQKRVYLMNPMNFIGKADNAPHWYIRHGARDRDTAFPVPVNFATRLQNEGLDVDFLLAWNRPHSGDYALDELLIG